MRELQNLIISFYTFCNKEVLFDDLPERIKFEKEHPQSDKSNIKTYLNCFEK